MPTLELERGTHPGAQSPLHGTARSPRTPLSIGSRNFVNSFVTTPLAIGSRSFVESFVPLNTCEPQENIEDCARVSRFAASLNMVNVIIGSGIVGLSFVVQASGVVPFTLFICFSAFLAYVTLTMLVEAVEYTPQKSYEAVGIKALGPYGLYLTSGVIILQNIGGMTSYLVLIAKTAPPILKLAGITGVSVKGVQVLITVVVCFPLCLLRDLSMLAYTSFFALCVFALVAATSVWYFAVGDPWYTSEAVTVHHIGVGAPVNWTSFSISAFSQLPTIIFAFVCHTACLPIYSQLRSPTKERMGTVCATSVVTALMLYAITGISGYLAYKGHTMAALVRNFRHCWDNVDEHCEDKNTYISVLNALFLMAVLLGYPSIHFPTRRAVIALVQGVDAQFSWIVHCGVAVVLVGGSLLLATSLNDVSTVFSWTGVIASPLIVFVLPAFYYQRIMQQEERLPVHDPKRLKAIGIVLFGLLFMAIGVFVKVSELV
jgi:sodium-coupled neutral amino acid transporter 3